MHLIKAVFVAVGTTFQASEIQDVEEEYSEEESVLSNEGYNFAGSIHNFFFSS